MGQPDVEWGELERGRSLKTGLLSRGLFFIGPKTWLPSEPSVLILMLKLSDAAHLMVKVVKTPMASLKAGDLM